VRTGIADIERADVPRLRQTVRKHFPSQLGDLLRIEVDHQK
jgi:hypothetical protein